MQIILFVSDQNYSGTLFLSFSSAILVSLLPLYNLSAMALNLASVAFSSLVDY